jgi:hypothetical protein
MQTGVEVFLEGLRSLGYEPITLSDNPNHVVIDYTVESGKFAATKVRLGFVVPPDFPITTPTGPHVSPRIHPTHPANDIGHPLGGVHDNQSAVFIKAAGGEWQYWSRPPAGWATSKKTVAAYLSHVWRLWDSQ